MKSFVTLVIALLFLVGCANISSGVSYEETNTEVANVQQPPTPQFPSTSNGSNGEKTIPFFRDRETTSLPCYYWIPTGDVEVIKKGDDDNKNVDNPDKKEE